MVSAATEIAVANLYHPAYINPEAAVGRTVSGVPQGRKIFQKSNKFTLRLKTHSQWQHLNCFHNIKNLLVRGDVETNPGPTLNHEIITATHANINSITCNARDCQVVM